MYNDSKFEKKKQPFTSVEVINHVIKYHLDVDDSVLQDYRVVVLDLNSILSILFHYEEEKNSEESCILVSELIETLISKCISLGSNIEIFYTIKPSSYHVGIYPEWCSERYSRVDIKSSTFMKAMITSLHAIADKNKSKRIIVTNTGEFHPVMFLKKYINNLTKTLIITKDPVFESIVAMNGAILYHNKIKYLDDKDRYKNEGINISPTEYKFYKAFAGDDRNGFPGTPHFGKIRSVDYIRNNSRIIKLAYANPSSPVTDQLKYKDYIKYAALYDYDKMLAYREEKEFGTF